ncbi:MAG: hypothetical protein RLZZ524_3068 [Pseudomonadota bacterium]|jgi:hypothetical protein
MQPDRRRLAAWGLTALLPWPAHAAPATTPGRTALPGPPGFSGAAVGASRVDGWEHQRLPKVARANQHEIVADESGTPVLRIDSAASASSWLTRLDLDVGAQPWLRWRWKVDRSLPGSDLRVKAGDDHAARLYVIFDLPLDRLSLADRLRISAARALSGADLPAAALCYVWGHAQPVGTTAWNPYTDRVRMVVVDSGPERAGRWQAHARHLARDWAEAFGGPMPRVSGFAVGADTDNTADRVTAWFGDLELAARADGSS